jgi:hypothetical protein
MGVNTINKLLPDLCYEAGITNWTMKHAHSLRGFGITRLANDPNVNQMEVARAARHSSARSQEAYIDRNEASEMARLRATGVMPRPEQDRYSLPPEASENARLRANGVMPRPGQDWYSLPPVPIREPTREEIMEVARHRYTPAQVAYQELRNDPRDPRDPYSNGGNLPHGY